MSIGINKMAIAGLALALVSFHVPGDGRIQGGDNQLTEAEKKSGWALLFDGNKTDSWRTYQNLPDDSWEVVAGELYCKAGEVQHRADLVTKVPYSSFELQLDWKVGKSAILPLKAQWARLIVSYNRNGGK